MPSQEDPVIESARLVIRPLGLDDAPRLQAVFEATPDHFAVVAGQEGATPESAAHELREAAARPGREVALISLADGTDVGAMGWWAAHPEPDVALLGMILVSPAHRGTGVAREALAALEGRLAARGIRRLRTAFQRRRLAIHPVVRALLRELGEPLVSSTLLLPGHDQPMTDGWSIKEELDHVVDAVLDSGDCGTEPTTVVDWSDGSPEVVRTGAGDATRFS